MSGRRLRLPRFLPGELDAERQALYDEIVGGPRASGPQRFPLTGEDGALDGPFNAFLLQPALGRAFQAVGASVRYQTSLPDRVRELAILVVANRWDSSFEWYAHEAIGRAVGLNDADLAAVRARDHEQFTDPFERSAVLVSDRLAWDGDLDDGDYGSASTTLGDTLLFELLALVGYYAALALQLRVYRVAAPSPDA